MNLINCVIYGRQPITAVIDIFVDINHYVESANSVDKLRMLIFALFLAIVEVS